MNSAVVEKSYIPQYIQFSPNASKPEYVRLETEADVSAPHEVIAFPPIDHKAPTSTGLDGYNQRTIYPQLNPNRGIQPSHFDPTVKTPLLAKKKIVPTKTNFFGVFLAFISGVFFTLCSGTVKYLTDVDPMELLIFRSSFQIAVTLPIALYKGHSLLGPPGSRLLLLFQGIVGGTLLVLLFYSFRLLPLGDAATIIFSSPVFVMVMSHIWLREPCGFYRTLIVFLLVTGVVFITKPPFLFSHLEGDVHESYNIIGYVCALFGTLFTALNIVIMRKCKDCHYSAVIFQFSFWSLVISSTILFIGGSPAIPENSVEQWILIVLVAVFGLSGQILVAIALTYEGAGRVAVTRSMDIVVAYGLQVLIFHEVPDWKSMMGALMVMICVIGMGLEDIVHKWMNNLP